MGCHCLLQSYQLYLGGGIIEGFVGLRDRDQTENGFIEDHTVTEEDLGTFPL